MTGQDRPGGLRDEAAAVRAELSKLAARVRMLQLRTEQLSALRAEESHAAAQIARLERVLDFDRVVAHVGAAVAHAELVGDPVPHVLVADLLPAEAYQALVDAIPSPVFFDGRAEQGQEMRVPPRLAPMSSIVTWLFVDEVARVLGDLLVTRLAEPLAAYTRAQFPSLPPFGDWGVELTVTDARLVRRAPGYAGRPSADHPWHLVSSVVHLAQHQDTEEYGSRLRAKAIAFRANSMLTWVGSPEVHVYTSIPADALATLERYTYEFGVGPTRDARRTLTALMAKTT